MKTKPSSTPAPVRPRPLPLLLLGLTALHADDYIKQNNTNSLLNGSSWVGNVAPGAGDTAVFDDIYQQTGTLGTGAPLNYAGIRVALGTVTDRVVVNNTTYANYIGLGLGGLDMSMASRDLKIVGFVANLGQTWNLAAGRTFEVGGTRFSGTGDIDITGAGLVILNGDVDSDIYSGTISVSGGTLRINSLEGGDVVVRDGGTLEGEAYLGGDLALGSATGAGLVIDPTTADALDVGELTLTGTNTVYLTGLPGSAGSVDVVAYTLLNGAETNFALDPAVGARLRNAPVFSDTLSSIALEFIAGDTLSWTGAAGGDWDLNTTANWDNGGASTFFDFDSVVFGDGAATTTVTITGDVAPLSTSFTNTAGNDYTVGGPGGIGGAGGLSKTGNGTVTLTGTNAFTGATTVDEGTLVVDITAGDPLAETSTVSVNAPGTLRLVHDDSGFDIADGVFSGDGTVGLNPHNVAGSAANLNVTLAGDNGAFTGTLVLEAPQSGTWRLSQPGAAALGGATVTVEGGAQLWAANSTYYNAVTISGDGFADANGPIGALRLNGSTSSGTNWDGPVTITGTPGDSGGVAWDASIGFNAGSSGSYYAYVNGPVGGGDLGVLGYSGNGNEWITLTAANSYGDTIVRANDTATGGQTAAYIGGVGNTTATLGTGDVHLIGGAGGKAAALRIQREDGYALPGDVLGAGSKERTVLIVDTVGAGVSTNGMTIDIGEQIRISANVNDSVMNIDNGSSVTCGELNVGHSNNRPGTLNQTGGDLVVTGNLNVANGTGQTSTYTLGGGTVNVGGTLNAGLGGTGIVNLDGGTVTLSSGGIGGSAGSQLNLGGATLVAGANCSVNVPLTVTAASTFDVGGNYVELQAGIAGSGDLEVADTSAGTLVVTVAGDTTYDGSLSGNGAIEKDGTGTWTLGGASTLTGGITVFQGGFGLTGSLSGSDLFIDGGALHTGGSLAGNLSIGELVDSRIVHAGAPLAVVGNVTLAGTNEVDPFAFGTPAAGTYPLITYTGTLTGGAPNLSMPAGFVPGNYRQTFSFNAAGGSIDLVVSGTTANLKWDGAASTSWDINNSAAWTGDGGLFFNLDEALFDDTATNKVGSVTIAGDVEPGSVTVNNDELAYTFSGGGSIDGATALLKQGPGTLTVNNVNRYTGGTVIEDGVVEVATPGALGDGGVTVAGGTLRVLAELGIPASTTITMGAPGSGNGDIVLEFPPNPSNSGDQVTLSSPIVVSSDAPDARVILRYRGGASGAAASQNGTITLQDHDVWLENTSDVIPTQRLFNFNGKFTGTGDVHVNVPSAGARVRMRGTENDFVGDVYNDSGFLQTYSGGGGTRTCVPDTADIIMAPGTVLGLGASEAIDALVGDGDVRANLSSNTSTVTLTVGADDGSGVFDGNTLDLYGTIGGGRVALTKVGAGTQVLNGNCDHRGSTTVSGGTLVINCPVFSSAVTVQGGATVGGSGVLGSNLTATQPDATVAPGAAIGTLTVNGNANLGGGTLAVEIDDAADPRNDRLDVLGTLTLSGATLDVTAAGGAAQAVYIIASYGSLSGTFAVENVPAGYQVDYNYQAANQVALKFAGGSDYDSWAAGFGLTGPDADPAADPDGDGVANEDEYAFGLDPTSAASVTAVSAGIEPTAGTFTYTRRDPSLTGLGYTVETSATMEDGSWVPDAGAVQNVIDTAGGVQTVEVTLSPSLLNGRELFARVVAQ